MFLALSFLTERILANTAINFSIIKKANSLFAFLADTPRTHFFVRYNYTPNEDPQPQVEDAFGLLKVKPRLFKPFSQSISIPAR